MANLPPLPEGFQLDSAPVDNRVDNSIPPLPEGFQLDQSAVDKSAGEQAAFEKNQAQYGTPGQQAIAGLEAVGQGVAGPLAPAAERALGVNPEDIRGREEANPITHMVGTAAGLLSPIGGGALLEKAGAKALELAAPKLATEGVLAGVQRGAVKLAAENALFQSGDEVSKLIKEDPNQSLGSAVSNVGLAAVLGGGLGGSFSAISPLWKAVHGTKAGEIASDFKARMQEHLGVEAPVEPAVDAAPTTKEVYDPFTKETRTIESSEPVEAKATRIDPFTKEEIPLGQTPSAAIGELPKPKPYEPTPVESPTHQKYDQNKPEVPLTTGEKLADALVKKSHDYLTSGVGATLGATVGHMTGIPGAGALGALLGERSLGPFLKSVLPGIAKSVVEKLPSGEGLKSVIDYGNSITKGFKLSDSAIQSVVSSGSKLIIPEATRPSPETREKLNTALQLYQQNPEKLANLGSGVGHYLPDHATAIGMTTSNAVNFLNSIKPQTTPKAPLDPPRIISQAVQAQYNRALDIAQQPLIVFESIKNGTLTSHDVIALHTLYPQLYAGLRQRVMNQIVEHQTSGETVPYDTRLGLSMFLQQPLDSTMSPQAIMAAQPAPEQSPQSQAKPKKMSQSAASNMNKGNKLAQTASQASEAMHATGAKA